MTKNPFRAALAAGATALLLCAPNLAAAGMATGGSVPADHSHLAQAAAQLTLDEEDAVPSMFAQAAAASRPRVLQVLRGASDVALWNLVATIHAQQKSHTFDLVDANVKTVWEIEKNNVSAVPLPAAMWLFVMGLLGLAGTRLTRTAGEARARDASPRDAHLPALPLAAAA